MGHRDSLENHNEREIDRQLAGQSSSTPFMNKWDGHNKGVIHTMDGIEQKIDELTVMMGK